MKREILSIHGPFYLIEQTLTDGSVVHDIEVRNLEDGAVVAVTHCESLAEAELVFGTIKTADWGEA